MISNTFGAGVHIFLVYGGLPCFDAGFWFSGLALFRGSQICDLQVPYGKDYVVLIERYFPCEAVLTSTNTLFMWSLT